MIHKNTMSIIDVIQKANEFVTATTGAVGDPCQVRLVNDPTSGKRWHLMYGPALFFPKLIESGSVIDGGELCITVDDRTGDVSVS